MSHRKSACIQEDDNHNKDNKTEDDDPDTSDSDADASPQIYCGIWMQLDAILGRDQVVNVWDKREPRFPRIANAGSRKKDGLKSTSSRSRGTMSARRRPIERTLA